MADDFARQRRVACRDIGARHIEGRAHGAQVLGRFPYRVADRLVEVNDAWTRFAHNNGAPELAPDAVLGRSLWTFIADPTTRRLYEALVARAREGSPRTVPYRCDVPAAKRLMRMTITADGT